MFCCIVLNFVEIGSIIFKCEVINLVILCKFFCKGLMLGYNEILSCFILVCYCKYDVKL